MKSGRETFPNYRYFLIEKLRLLESHLLSVEPYLNVGQLTKCL